MSYFDIVVFDQELNVERAADLKTLGNLSSRLPHLYTEKTTTKNAQVHKSTNKRAKSKHPMK